MAIKKQMLPILDAGKEALEISIDAADKKVWRAQELKRFLFGQDSIVSTFRSTSLQADDLIDYLTQYSYLQKIKFKTPRTENLFLWRTVDKLTIFPVLRPNGYYTHQTAMYIHGLDQFSNVIYFNNEQPIRPTSGVLEQSRIDNAFSKGQRLTSARTTHGGIEYWLLNGKQTGNYGVTALKTIDNIEVSVTDIERTLVDLTVRPAYAGGVNNVLIAYRLAQPKLSIQKLVATINALQYVYPYYQSIGFYLDISGVYREQDIQHFLNFGPFQYDFYLDYKMLNPNYSEKWRLYYPNSLIA